MVQSLPPDSRPKHHARYYELAVLAILLLAVVAFGAEMPRDDGYRGIWYYNQPSKDQYVYKYSGGFATYPQQMSPMAIYSAKAAKTFFVYGGTVTGKQELLNMVSYFDHKTGKFPRPVILANKHTGDAHDNAVLSIDDAGFLWVFSNAHGTAREAYIWRGDKPYSIDGFTRMRTTNFSYGHPRYIPGQGFLFLQTLYQAGKRNLFWTTSADGKEWTDPAPLARMDMGHYQIVAQRGNRVASVFNYHPTPLGLNARTNLYYIETSDMGKSWKTVDGAALATPLTDIQSPALVHDYGKEKRLVYLKTVDFDAAGNPVILFLTSAGFESGPKNGPRQWKTARWTGKTWEIRDFTTSDHNYDFGSLYIEADGTWRIIAPTAPGPQPYTTGGDMVMWTSRDQGRKWTAVKQLTHARQFNHTYARKPVNARPEFYSIWADGDTLKPSESSLYFTDKGGRGVWRLPAHMKGEFALPEMVK
jgi:hypothetical protein